MWSETEKKPILPYIVLTFSIAWCAELLLILGDKIGVFTGKTGVIAYFIAVGFGAGLAPTYAVFILMAKHKKICGIKDFCRLIFRSNHVLKTTIFTVLFFLVFLVLNILNNDYLYVP